MGNSMWHKSGIKLNCLIQSHLLVFLLTGWLHKGYNPYRTSAIAVLSINLLIAITLLMLTGKDKVPTKEK